MCGRLDQNDISRILANFDWVDEVLNRSEAAARWNVPPGTYRPVLHVEDGKLVADDVFWSYRPAWAAAATPAPPKKQIPIAVNAKVEKLLGAYWKPLMRAGRGIVCANGWYEWTGAKGNKQPWHIHRKDGEPLFLLALANFGPFVQNREEAGFVLVTADSLGGMVDVHDRRPVAVSEEDARRWLDPTVTPEEAEHIARTAMLDVAHFTWFPVTRALNAGTDGPEVATRIDLPAGAELIQLEL
jgi:putative SOS response-associated peptidase YedK